MLYNGSVTNIQIHISDEKGHGPMLMLYNGSVTNIPDICITRGMVPCCCTMVQSQT